MLRQKKKVIEKIGHKHKSGSIVNLILTKSGARAYLRNARKGRSEGGGSGCTDQYVLNNVKKRFHIKVPAVGNMDVFNLFHDRVVIGSKHPIADPLSPLLKLVRSECGCHILSYWY